MFLKLLDVMVSCDQYGDVVLTLFDWVPGQVPHVSMPDPNMEIVKLVLFHI